MGVMAKEGGVMMGAMAKEGSDDGCDGEGRG